MILRGSYKPEALYRAISRHFGDGRVRPVSGGQDIVYLGDGYWRAQLIWYNDVQLMGACLINPDRTGEEIALVEQGIAIIERLEYSPQAQVPAAAQSDLAHPRLA